jgi:hypothetical protein
MAALNVLGARATMDRPETEAWFAAQPTPFRLLVLLEVMHWLTIALRDVATRDGLDARARWDAAYLVSECNHRLVGYNTAVMTGQPHYPDDVIIDILFDYLDHPNLAPYTHGVWDSAVENATRFGAHLRQ